MSWWTDTYGRPSYALGPRKPIKKRFKRFRDWRLSLIHAPRIVRTPNAAIRQSALAAVGDAFSMAERLKTLANGAQPDAQFFDVYPGEHYALLAALCKQRAPLRIVEVGTFTGMSARVFLDHAPQGARIDTFDIFGWESFQTHLTKADFDSGRIVQHLADIAEPDVFAAKKQLFEEADLVFMDGPKDGAFEQKVLPLLMRLSYKPDAIMLLDDIRLDAMIEVWDDIEKPKLDLTGFGHWSGTGLVQLGAG